MWSYRSVVFCFCFFFRMKPRKKTDARTLFSFGVSRKKQNESSCEDTEIQRAKQLSMETFNMNTQQKKFTDRLERNMKDLNLTKRRDVPADGNCFFHCIADQQARVGMNGEYDGVSLRHDLANYLKNLEADDPLHEHISPSYLTKIQQNGTWADEIAIRGTAQMLRRSIHIVTSQEESSERGYLMHKINDGVTGEALLLGHIGELHYISLDKQNETIQQSPKSFSSDTPAAPESACSSSEANICVLEQCEAQCCVKNEPNQPKSADILRKTNRQYIVKGHKKTRCVQPQWFDQYKWLTLCESRQKLFCFICKKEHIKGTLTFSKNADSAFVLDGFDNWKKALEKLESYQQTKCHKEAVEKHAASKRSQVNTQLDTHYRLNQSVRQIGLITFFVFSVLHIATRTSC